MGGEAKRRQAWIAKGGQDWGLRGYRPHTKRTMSTRGLSEDEIKEIEEGRESRRNQQKLSLCGFRLEMHKPSKHANPQMARRPQARGR